jgi:hypothetical protein
MWVVAWMGEEKLLFSKNYDLFGGSKLVFFFFKIKFHHYLNSNFISLEKTSKAWQ